jgi:thioredoxin-dependent peroxiredoxin
MNNIPYDAPSFELLDADNQTRKLSDFADKWLVLYFYPKDDTPGCTTEACSMRDSIVEIQNLGAEVVGVSKDSVESHQKFRAKYHLNFTLLSDPDHAVIESYGAWGTKMFGNEGTQRKTFIINPKGKVVKVYPRVTPLGHGGQIIEDLKTLQSNAS